MSPYCLECGSSSRGVHNFVWFDNALDALLPGSASGFVPYPVGSFFGWCLEIALLAVRLVHKETTIDLDQLPPRSALFVRAAQKRGISLTAIRGPFGYTGHFLMHLGDEKTHTKTFRFEGLPNAERLNGRLAEYADDKWKVKSVLQKNGFPVAAGRTFWQWNVRAAVRYGAETLGFPLVVKPRNGSVARHVTINITDAHALQTALEHAFAYSPVAIVEQYVPGFVHRFTVVDDVLVACVRQLPAHVDGDGVHTVQSLIVQKNARPERHIHHDAHSFFHSLAADDDAKTTAMLSKQNRTFDDMPPAGVRVWLADDPFMRNGGDLEDMTDAVHPDNRALAQDVAKLFGMKLVGIDFICEDVAKSWKEQRCAILELNSLPSIEMHHSPSYGKPQDVAGAIADMVVRYYK